MRIGFQYTRRSWIRWALISVLTLAGLGVLLAGALPLTAQSAGPESIPDTPDKPTATAKHEGMLDLEWNEVPGATSYDVQAFYSDWFDLPGNGVELAFYGPGAIIKGLIPGSRYYFRVRANNSLGSSDWSEHRLVNPTGGDFGNWDDVPEPTNNTATGAPTIDGTPKVYETLTADISGIKDENGLDRVKFHYQWVSIDGTDEEDIDGGTDASYVLVADDEGRFIQVRVSFTDRGGYAESVPSAATTEVEPPPKPPSPPLNLEVTNNENGELALSWEAPASDGGSAVMGYKVRWKSENEEYGPSREASVSVLSYTVGELTNGVEHSVQVVPVNKAGDGEAAEITATPRETIPPQLLTARLVNNVTVTLTYDEPLDATSEPATSAFSVLFNSDPSGSPAREVSEVAVFGNTVRLTLASRVGPDTVVSYSAPQDTGEQRLQDRAGNDAPSFDDELVANHLPADDHGDTPENATVLSPDAKPTRGEIKPHGDVDYFRIEVGPEEAGYISILFRETIIPRSFHSYAGMKLFDSDGNCATRGCDRWSYKENFYVLLEEGVYYLRVTGLNTLVIDENPDRLDYLVQWEPTNAVTRMIRECDDKQDRFEDPLYGCQDNLHNRTHPGEDINVEPAWASGALGQGIKIVVVDGGIDDLHQDLAGAVDVEESVPTRSGRFYQPWTEHGTNIAGIIAARHNLTGMRGIAPAATLLNYTIVSFHSPGVQFSSSLNEEVKAITHHHEKVAVSNNSWAFSYPENGMPLEMPGSLQEGIEKGIEDGFGGKGISYVFAVGNELFNSNLFGNLTHHAVIPVCGVNDAGRVFNYLGQTSGYGSTLWVCAPYENLTTRRNHTYGTVHGTSFSTAVVSGVTALVRGANKSLTWRDVKVILAESTRQNDPDHGQWTAGAVKYGSDTERYHYNEYYGFGVVDAGAAVDLARSWTNLPTMKTVSAGSEQTNLTIPDPEEGAAATTLSDTITLGTRVGFTEFVEINIEFDHPSFRDLGFEIVSPSGTVSMLAEPDESWRNLPFSERYRFASAKHLGEDPTGTWTLKVTDHVPGEEGVIRGWDIKIYGHGNGTARTVNPRIVGRAQVGETLTADTSGIDDEDGLTNVMFSFQWNRSDGGLDSNIQGANGATYTLVKADEGKTLWVTVSFTDAEGNPETLTSDPTGKVAAKPNTEATGAPTIDGIARVGETLTADVTGIDDDDSLANVAFSYQWLRNDGGSDSNIQDATGSTYTLVSDDEGKTIKVTVSFTDGEGNPETLTSDPTGEVAPASGPLTAFALVDASTDPDKVLGTLEDGDTLTLEDPDNVSYGIRVDTESNDDIQKVELALSGAKTEGKTEWEPPYSLYGDSGEDSLDGGNLPVGSYDLTATAYDTNGDVSGTLTVSFTVEAQEQTAVPNNEPTGAPIIDGAARVGQTLTADTSGINDDDGLTNVVFAYQWTRSDGSGDTNIQDATGSSYTLTEDDEGRTIKVTVSFTDGEGNPESLTSDPTGEVEAKPNTEATGAPIIDGIARVSQTLTADTSGIDDEDELTNVAFSYQWLADDADIAGATGAAYTLVADDEGKAIKVVVSFTDDRGNEEMLASDPTGEVAPESGPLATFTLVDASTAPDTLLGALEDGRTLTLEDPDNVSYGIRVDTDSNDDIQKVVLALSGAKDVSRPEKHSPYSLYGDDGEDNLTGEDLPVGSYTLTATAYDTNGDVSGTLKVSFIVAAQEQTAVPNTEATGAPIIGGFARVGQTLTADTSGINDDDGLTNVAFSYQWLRSDGSGDSNIQDATGSSYTLTGDDEGRTIKVTVSFTDGEGNPESLTSDPTGAVDSEAGPLTAFTVVDTSTDPDKVLGTLEDGRTLTLAAPAGDSYGIRVDTESNDDIQKVELALSRAKTEGKTEWEPPYSLYGDSGEENLTGEDLPAGSYDLTATAYKNNGDVMGTLKVSFSVAYADPAEEQPPAQNTLATGAPTIDGIARVGETLTADTSGIHDDDGLTNALFSYQWLRSDGGLDTNITGATGATYTLVAADEGKTIKVTVSFTDAEGNPETLTSDPTGEVEAKPNTEATGAPTIDGIARVGETLTADTSGIHDDDGLNNVAFGYQWTRSDGGLDTNITGATGATYTLVSDDEGKTIKVTVSFTDGEGNPETLTSEATGVVTAEPNTKATGAPIIDGIARVGGTLTADISGISDDDGLTNVAFSYQWTRNDGSGDTEIQDATGSSYTLVKADEGKTIKVRVSFTDEAGHAESLTSDSTGVVAAAETVPGRPQDLAGEASEPGIKLTWSAPSGSAVTQYVVYRGELENGSMNGRPMTKYTTIDETGADMAYTDGDVKAGVEYRYRVAAVNSAGEGRKSNWINIFASESQS